MFCFRRGHRGFIIAGRLAIEVADVSGTGDQDFY